MGMIVGSAADSGMQQLQTPEPTRKCGAPGLPSRCKLHTGLDLAHANASPARRTHPA